MNTRIAFRLIGISSDLDILKAHLEHIEEQEKQLRLSAEDIRNDLLKDRSSLNQDDREAHRQFAQGVYDEYVEFRLPRIFHNPFLVSLYAVYESAVIEIAKLTQERKGVKVSSMSIVDAKKCCRDTLKFNLTKNSQSLERLTELRNAIAHANGHLELVREKKRNKIKKWIKQDIGIEDDYGDIIVSGAFVREAVEIVKGELENLIERLKEWNSTTEVH